MAALGFSEEAIPVVRWADRSSWRGSGDNLLDKHLWRADPSRGKIAFHQTLSYLAMRFAKRLWNEDMFGSLTRLDLPLTPQTQGGQARPRHSQCRARGDSAYRVQRLNLSHK
jgi:hypothetical protein